MEKGKSYKQTDSKNNTRGFQSTNSNGDQQNQNHELIQSEKMQMKFMNKSYVLI